MSEINDDLRPTLAEIAERHKKIDKICIEMSKSDCESIDCCYRDESISGCVLKEYFRVDKGYEFDVNGVATRETLIKALRERIEDKNDED